MSQTFFIDTRPTAPAATVLESQTTRRFGGSQLLTCLLMVFSVACAGRQAQDTTIHLDTTALFGGIDRDFTYATPGDLFSEANELLRDGEYEESLARYEFLLDTYPEVDFERAILFNSALCLEGLDAYPEAAERYAHIVGQWPASDDATDALYRWAEARSQLGDYEGVVPLMDRALGRPRLTQTDRIEAHLRRGHALLEMRQYARAENNYREALSLNREADLDPDLVAIPEDHPMVAQALFGLGRVYHELMLDIKLVLPQDIIQRALVDKAQLLDQAREAYVRVVRGGHPYWSVAAGFMIGQTYEDFFLDVLACEVPQDFNELTVEVYFEQLRSYLDPVVQRALEIYEDNLSLAERLGTDSVWVEETVRGIERIQSYLFDPNVQAEQQRLILEQQHPHGAQDRNRAWLGSDTPES